MTIACLQGGRGRFVSQIFLITSSLFFSRHIRCRDHSRGQDRTGHAPSVRDNSSLLQRCLSLFEHGGISGGS